MIFSVSCQATIPTKAQSDKLNVWSPLLHKKSKVCAGSGKIERRNISIPQLNKGQMVVVEQPKWDRLPGNHQKATDVGCRKVKNFWELCSLSPLRECIVSRLAKNIKNPKTVKLVLRVAVEEDDCNRQKNTIYNRLIWNIIHIYIYPFSGNIILFAIFWGRVRVTVVIPKGIRVRFKPRIRESGWN